MYVDQLLEVPELQEVAVPIGSNICLNRTLQSQRFVLLCDIEPVNLTAGIRTALPTPNRTWTTDPDNIVITSALDGDAPELNLDFLQSENGMIFLPGLIEPAILDVSRSDGVLAFSTEVSQFNPEILPDLVERDRDTIRELVFEEILGSYTCMVENVYGFDLATTLVTECGESYSEKKSSTLDTWARCYGILEFVGSMKVWRSIIHTRVNSIN